MSHKFLKLKFAVGAAALIAMLGFAQVKPEQVQANSLYVEQCELNYTKLNHVACKAYIKINGIEAEAIITEVDYSYLNDVDVSYTLDHYNIDEKAVYDELRAYFDDRRTAWIQGI